MSADLKTPPVIIPETRAGRILYGLVVIALPVLSFWLSPALAPEWQSGKMADYAALLLNPNAAVYFFPLLLYPMICMALLLRDPARNAAYFAVRFGIYSGILLALQYVLLLAAAVPASLAVDAVLFPAIWAGGRLRARFGGRVQAIYWAGLLIAASLAFLWRRGYSQDAWQENLSLMPFGLLFVLFSAAPCACLVILSMSALKLYAAHDAPLARSPGRGAGLGLWLAGYAAAWALSVRQMLNAYASLPPSPPCYVATAAARGHPWIVGSRLVRTASGPMRVNAQLRQLKCAELALLALAPRLHRRVRAVYDAIGPPLARRMGSPLLADLAYLGLKPLEWLSRAALRGLVPDVDEYAARLYRCPASPIIPESGVE